MAKVIVNVDNAAGTLVTPGPIRTATNVRITRTLDGPGSISFSVPLTDERALLLLDNERRVSILSQSDESLREVGAGIIRSLPKAESSGGKSVNVTGPDVLESLRDSDTGRNLIYNQQPLQTVVDDLVARVGWSATIEDGYEALVVDARFDGVTILKALQKLVKTYGLHLRLADADKTVEIGVFGQSNGLRVFKAPSTISDELRGNPAVLLVESISIASESEGLVNVIEPIGGGKGINALTLEGVAATGAYAIQSEAGNDGETIYTLEDSASVAQYGRRRRTFVYGDIAPLSNTDADIANARAVLYQAAVVDLRRMSQVQKHYKMTLKNVKQTLKPGDKLNIRYRGQIYRDGQPITYADINGDFWIVKVTESVGDENRVEVEVNSVDELPVSPAKKIVESMNEVRRMSFQPGTSTTRSPYPYTFEIAPNYPVRIPVEITRATLYVNRLRVRLQTAPFRATARAAREGGDHRHLMFKSKNEPYRFNQQTAFPVTFNALNFYCQKLSLGSFFEAPTPWYGNPLYSAGDMYTYEGSGAHTHDLEFAITDDTQYPQQLQIFVDGTDRTAALAAAGGLGATIAPTNSAIDIVLDEALMTRYIHEAPGGLRQNHTIEIRCGAGQGLIQATVEIYEGLQEIAAND